MTSTDTPRPVRIVELTARHGRRVVYRRIVKLPRAVHVQSFVASLRPFHAQRGLTLTGRSRGVEG